MGDFKKQICRLCLGVIPAGVGEVIQETEREKLEVLLINIDFDISDNAIACSRCLEKLQDCFDFKSTCSYMDNYIASCKNVDVKVDIESVFEEAISKENVNFENDQMCRLCMSLIKDQTFTYSIDLKDDFFLKDTLRNCFLEVDLNTAHVPLICKRCISGVKKYSEFMKTCHEVEERIKNHCQVAEGYGITARVFLEDVLEFKNCGALSEPIIVIEKDCLDVENNDMTAMECFNGENTASIKCEEVDIKDELDIKIETSEAVLSGNCNNSGMNGFSVRKIYAKTEENQSLQEVQECYLCSMCSFDTDTLSLINAHMMSHKGSTKTFRCHQCPYETNYKPHLKLHFLKHKDNSEVEMHKCPLCPYKSKYKSSALEHRRLKHDPNTKVYNCKECSYSTKRRKTFLRHEVVHKNPGEVPMYKCQNCNYENKFKPNLMHHMRIHSLEYLHKFRFNTFTKVFECLKCTYETGNKPELVQHFLRHKWKAVMHMCPRCPFQSKHKYTVVEHWKLQHEKNSKVYKCNDCSYSTKQKTNFKRHQAVHKNPEYKCEKCPFYTKYKTNLTLHMVVHDDSAKYKCEICPYQCKRQAEVKRHMMAHSNENLYSCGQCTYYSHVYSNLHNHMLVHQADCTETLIQCDQCDFHTKYKRSLRRHKQLHDATQPRFQCDKCKYSTIEKSKLKKHQVKHMELRDTLVYCCLTCNYKTKYKQALSSHMIQARKCVRSKKIDDKKTKKYLVSQSTLVT